MNAESPNKKRSIIVGYADNDFDTAVPSAFSEGTLFSLNN